MGGTLLMILFFPLSFLLYGLANRNIASNANRNTNIAFWFGLFGGLGMVICLLQSVEATWKKVLFGFGRLFVCAIGIQILGEFDLVSESQK